MRHQKFAPVAHATLDPEGTGVVRLHLVSPRPDSPAGTPHVLVINGWDVIPIGESWANLLRTFLDTLNAMSIPGEEISQALLRRMLRTVTWKMWLMYPLVNPKRFERDLQEMVSLSQTIARGDDTPARFSKMTLHDFAPFMRGPMRMDLIVSPMRLGGKWVCPLHCRNCYAMQDAMSIEKELTTAEWKAIIDRTWEIGIPQITFTGGEPLEREDIVELVAYARNQVTRLNTNGVKMTPELARNLREASLDGIQFTLYSPVARIHDALVGVEGAWEKTVAGIGWALEAGLQASVNTPLVTANKNYSDMLEFLDTLGVRHVACSGLIPTGGAVASLKNNRALENEELMEVMKKAVVKAQALGMELSFTSPGWLTAEQLGELGLQQPICGAGLANMAVLPNGNVSLCQSWLNDAGGLGNIMTVPWETIWNNPKAVKLRQAEIDQCPLASVEED